MNPESKTWATVLTESAISFALIVLAIFIAGCLQELLTPGFLGAYIFYFAFAMTPFVLFARSRGVLIRFDRWDVVASFPMLVVIALAGSASFHFRNVHPILMFAIPASMVLSHPLFKFVRSRLPGVPPS